MKKLLTALMILAVLLCAPAAFARESSTTEAGSSTEAEAEPVGETAPGDEPDWCSNGKGQPRTFENLNSPSVKIHVNGNNGASDAEVTVHYGDAHSVTTTIPQGQSDTFQADPTHGNVTKVSIESSESGVKTCGTLDAKAPKPDKSSTS